MDREELNRVFQKILDKTPSTKQNYTKPQQEIQSVQVQRNDAAPSLTQPSNQMIASTLRSWKWGILLVCLLMVVVAVLGCAYHLKQNGRFGVVSNQGYSRHSQYSDNTDYDEDVEEDEFEIVESERDPLFQPLE
jgi:hypothetical protein